MNASFLETKTEECHASLSLLTEPGSLFEIRVLPMGRHKVFRADPDGLNGAAAYAAKWSDDPTTKGVYVTLNPLGSVPANAATDSDVARRAWLLIDIDPERPADTNATDAEIEGAINVHVQATMFLGLVGMRHEVKAPSGNGYHALFPIDLPNDEASRDLIKEILVNLARVFNKPWATVDTTVYNASRIVKLYGTYTRKGPHSEERPWRQARLIGKFHHLTPNPVEILVKVRDTLRTIIVTGCDPTEAALGHVPVPTARPAIEGTSAVIETTCTVVEPSPEAPRAQANGQACAWSIPVNGRPDALTRARAYLAKCEPAISGQHGHDKAFKAACKVGPGFDLTPEETLQLLREVYNPTCEPPWSEKELLHKVQEAYKVETRRGFLRDEERKDSQGADYRAPSGGEKEAAADEEVIDRWPTLNPEAYQGIAGEIVDLVEYETEADPVAILVQFLIGFGNLIGRKPYFQVGADRHYTNEFACIVGPSSSARKGMSQGIAFYPLGKVDEAWAKYRNSNGCVSGEGLIYHVRDERKLVDKKGNEIIIPGVLDKRLVANEPEFGRLLTVMSRNGNTISGVMRPAWDGKTLANMGKNSPDVATDAHISMIGHVTIADLKSLLDKTNVANGFANRILWVAARRQRELPSPPNIEDFEWGDLLKQVETAAGFARARGRLVRDTDAEALWVANYHRLCEEKPGLLGSITARSEAHAMRLATIYALIDRSIQIRSEHLKAALALIDYCTDTVRMVFGDELGDPDAEKLIKALRESSAGLTRKEITSVVFRGNRSRDQITRLLSDLLTAGMIHMKNEKSKGPKPTERWFFGRQP